MTIYYVSTNGNNGNSGLSKGAAFKTIQHAADLVSPGDIVEVAGGIYKEVINIRTGGESGNKIVFRAASGESPTLDGQYLLPPKMGPIEYNPYKIDMWRQDTALVNIHESYITWDGINIRNSTGGGIRVFEMMRDENGDKIRDDTGRARYHPKYGIVIENMSAIGLRNATFNLFHVIDGRISSCVLEDGANFFPHSGRRNVVAKFNSPPDSKMTFKTGDIIKMVNYPGNVQCIHGTSNFIFENNTCSYSYGSGIISDGHAGTTLDGVAFPQTNVIIRGNIMCNNMRTAISFHAMKDFQAYDNIIYFTGREMPAELGHPTGAFYVQSAERNFIEVGASTDCEDGVISNNLIINASKGLSFSTETPQAIVKNVLSANNTIIVDGNMRASVGIRTGIYAAPGVRFTNNVIYTKNYRVIDGIKYGYGGQVGRDKNAGSFDHNLWFGAKPVQMEGAGDVLGNPKFVVNPPIYPQKGEITQANKREWAAKFKIADDSLAKNAGATIPEVTDDFFGVPRSAGNYDIGFHELSTGEESRAVVAVIKSMPSTGVAPLTVDFSGCDSYAINDRIVGYSWTFGDEEIAA